mmetsp:Transcript_16396/g.39334  ORF Transcript_16396/g.39334 Transcript_16396/m.39334 type:complete len:203 (+) Transcript_16396:1472-2080(+)
MMMRAGFLPWLDCAKAWTNLGVLERLGLLLFVALLAAAAGRVVLLQKLHHRHVTRELDIDRCGEGTHGAAEALAHVDADGHCRLGPPVGRADGIFDGRDRPAVAAHLADDLRHQLGSDHRHLLLDGAALDALAGDGILHIGHVLDGLVDDLLEAVRDDRQQQTPESVFFGVYVAHLEHPLDALLRRLFPPVLGRVELRSECA